MSTTCTSCGTAGQPDRAKFCLECGAALRAVCPSCGEEVPPGAHFCPSCGSPLAATAGAAPAEQPVASRRITSVLFGDLVGFTTLSETRDHEDVRELLSAYFEECRRIVEPLRRHRREVHRRRGDGGVGRADRARGRRRARGPRRPRAGRPASPRSATDVGAPDLAMRVGIVTGEVAVTIGADAAGHGRRRRRQHRRPGPVGRGARPGLGRRDDPAAHDVGDHLRRRRQPRHEGQGRAGAAVGGARRGRRRRRRPARRRPRGAAGRPRPRAAAGQGALPRRRGVRAPGAARRRRASRASARPGSAGSSRSTSTACRARSAGTAAAACPTARASRTTRWPRRSGAGSRLLRPTTRTPSADDEDLGQLLERGLDALRARTPRSGPGSGPGSGRCSASGRSAPSPARTCSRPGRPSSRGSGRRQTPSCSSSTTPSTPTRACSPFLEHLLGVGDVPVLRAAARPTRAARARTRAWPPTGAPPSSTSRRWRTRDMAALLDGLVAGLPDDVRDALVARAEGVPLYAVETVRSLIDRDLVVPRGGQYVLADADRSTSTRVGAPASLQALIAARLDTLPRRRAPRRSTGRACSACRSARRRSRSSAPTSTDLDAVLGASSACRCCSRETNRFSAEFGQYRFVQGVVRQVAYGDAVAPRPQGAGTWRWPRLLEADDEEPRRRPRAGHRPALPRRDRRRPRTPTTPAALTERAVLHLEQRRDARRALGAPAEAAGHLRVALERRPRARTGPPRSRPTWRRT